MNTARIVVVAIAVGAGGIAAYPASGSDSPPQTAQLKSEQAETLARSRQTGTLALRSAADGNAPEIRIDDQRSRRGESINIVRYGINSPATVRK